MSETRHPDLPDGGWLGVSGGRLVALRLRPGGVEVLVKPEQVDTVVAVERVRLRGRRVRMDSVTRGRVRVRLVGPGDYGKQRLGESVGLDVGMSGGAGDDPISAVLGLIELAVLAVILPFRLARMPARYARGRREARRLAAALSSSTHRPGR
jgi:hypothetical protein